MMHGAYTYCGMMHGAYTYCRMMHGAYTYCRMMHGAYNVKVEYRAFGFYKMRVIFGVIGGLLVSEK
jgi:predicted membrane-bound mannosyltransferase